jgi:hypothetical protein
MEQPLGVIRLKIKELRFWIVPTDKSVRFRIKELFPRMNPFALNQKLYLIQNPKSLNCFGQKSNETSSIPPPCPPCLANTINLKNLPLKASPYSLLILGNLCLKPQRISQEIVFNFSAQSSAKISSSPSLPIKVTISPTCKSGNWLTSSMS